jgi:hypothetical protein
MQNVTMLLVAKLFLGIRKRQLDAFVFFFPLPSQTPAGYVAKSVDPEIVDRRP